LESSHIPKLKGISEMPRVDLDLTDVKEFAPIEDGPYPASVAEVSEVKTGPKSKYLTVTFEITDGEFVGRKLFRNYPISGAGAGFFTGMIQKATGVELTPGEMASYDTDDLLGARCTIVVKNEEYPEGSGDFRPQVDKVLSAKK
jgi:hypothetical protein